MTLVDERDHTALKADRDALAAEVIRLKGEHDACNLDEVEAERDGLVAELAAVRSDRNAGAAHAVALMKERDEARADSRRMTVARYESDEKNDVLRAEVEVLSEQVMRLKVNMGALMGRAERAETDAHDSRRRLAIQSETVILLTIEGDKARAELAALRWAPHPVTGEMPRWRVGRKVGRTLYFGDKLIGVMDTPGLADTVVRAVEAYSSVRVDSKPPVTEETRHCGGCGEPSAPWEGWQEPDAGKCWWLWEADSQMWTFLCRRERDEDSGSGDAKASLMGNATGTDEAAAKTAGGDVPGPRQEGVACPNCGGLPCIKLRTCPGVEAAAPKIREEVAQAIAVTAGEHPPSVLREGAEPGSPSRDSTTRCDSCSGTGRFDSGQWCYACGGAGRFPPSPDPNQSAGYRRGFEAAREGKSLRAEQTATVATDKGTTP